MVKQEQLSKLEVLSEYGFSKDPFEGFFMETVDSLRAKRLIKMAVASCAMISIVAPWTNGKSTALEIAFQDPELDCHVVRLITPDKERMVVSDIERALILGLPPYETCKRTKEVRARQIRRIVGEAAKDKPVVLILEEAHRIPPQTLRALKTFREMEWQGKCPLFTVIMIGQYDPMTMRGVDEVRLRTDTVKMKGLAPGEVKQYIMHLMGKHFNEDAAEAISRLDGARLYGELQAMIINLLNRALQHGSKKVSAVHVFEMYNGGIKELLKKAKMGLPALSKETGIRVSTLSHVTTDKQDTMTEQTMKENRAAIAAVLSKRLRVDIQQAEPLKVTTA